MHEMSLAESILQLIEDAARTHDFARVRRVRLEIGRFACVEAEALRFGFAVVAKGSRAEGARLDIVETPGRGTCLDCGTPAEMADRLDPCPACGGVRLVPTGGDEMRIRDLEVA